MPSSARTLLAIVAFALLFVGVSLLGTRLLSSVRVDMTASEQHTLAPGSIEIASGLDRPVRLTFFYSSEVASRLPEVVAHAQTVRRILERLEEASGGMLIVDEIDPAPFSEAEDRAVSAGIASVRTSDGTLYFGIAGSNDLDGAQHIGYLDPALASRAEYDIAQAIYLLSQSNQPRVGLISSLPLRGEMINVQMRGRPWAVYNALERVFDLVPIERGASSLPENLDALLIVHPKELPTEQLRAIEQATLGGLPVVLAVDPNCEADVPAEARDDPRALAEYAIDSDLQPLLEAWGVVYDASRVVFDREHAVTVRVPRGDEVVSIDYVASLRLPAERFATGVRAMERLETLTFGSAGFLQPSPNATTSFTPLVTTGDDAMTQMASTIRFSPNPQQLLRAYSSDDRSYTIAARIEGPAIAAIARTAPTQLDSGTIRATVIADADFLADRYWVEPRRIDGRIVGAVRRADNAEMLIGLLAEYAASDALLSIAPRERQLRGFTTIATMRREAQQQFAAEEQRLRELLQSAERRINELGAARDGAGGFLLAEQRAEMQRVESTRADVRRRLREVRFELEREIEAIGTRVKLLNIVAVPVLVVLVTMVIAIVRRSRRASERRAQRGGAS